VIKLHDDLKVHRREILPSLFLALCHVWDANGWLCKLVQKIFSQNAEEMGFLCSPRQPGQREVRVSRCPGPGLRVNAE